MKDAVLGVRGGLYRGVSPGFQVPPSNVVRNAEQLIPEPGNPGVFIRQVNEGVLYEFSVVTRPAYDDTLVDVRSEPEPEIEPVIIDYRRFWRWL